MMTSKDAFNSIFNRIFNQGRHIGTILVALHQTGVLKSDLTKYISNVILNPQTNLGSERNVFFMQECKEDVKRYLAEIE